MKYLVLALFMFSSVAFANEAATKCESEAREAARAVVGVYNMEHGLRLQLKNLTYSNGTYYRFRVYSGYRHLGSYEVEIKVEEDICFAVDYQWTISPRD